MVRRVALVLAALLGCGGGSAEPTLGYVVTAMYPHDPAAFTQGLELDGDTMLEGTGLRRQSTLRRVAVTSGEVLASVPLGDEHFGEGITRFGDTIYQLTWMSGTCFLYGAASFEPAGTLAYEGEGWGLTHDATSLIMSDGSSVLTFRDPASFAAQRTVAVVDDGAPVEALNELEMVRGELWANVWFDTRIARIDPATGVVIGWVELSALVPSGATGDEVLNGIAYDAARDRVLVTGKRWPVLYELAMAWPADSRIAPPAP